MSFFTTYSSLLLPLLAATVLLSSSTDAFFILSHPKTLVHTRLDPIVNPGQISGHMHNVVGANSFNRSYDLTLQREATCTTSPVQADLSTYWAPQLYYQAENGSLTIVPTAFVQTYYLNRNGPKKQEIKAFPPGLRMLAGDPKRTTFNASLFTNTAISFVCLDYAGGHDNDPAWAQRNSFFEHDCPDGQRLQINFPSCWNGVDLDSTDHKSHMSYPIQNVDGGDCPDSHPIQLVSLFYEFVYQTNLYPYREGAFVLATGDTTGYGNHADFADGWDTTVLQNAIDTCPDDTSGNIEICPALAASIDRSKQQACQPVNEVVDEDTGLGTWLSSLPGNNPVKDSSGQAINSASKTDYTETATFISPAGVLPGGWKAEGCFTEGIGARALQGFSLVNEAMTIDICLNACKAEGFAFAGLEFGKECYCDSSLGKAGSTNVATPAPVCAAVCPGNPYANCGGASTLSVFSYDANYVAPTTTASSPSVVVPTSFTDVDNSNSSSDSGSDIEVPSTDDEDSSTSSPTTEVVSSPAGTAVVNEEAAKVDVEPTSPSPTALDSNETTPATFASASPAQPSSSSSKAKARRMRAQARRSRMHHRSLGGGH